MSFMIPNSTAEILFPGIHKQGNSAGRIILLIKASIHTETPWRRTRLPRGEQLFCHERELKSCPLVTRVPTAQEGQLGAPTCSLREFCRPRRLTELRKLLSISLPTLCLFPWGGAISVPLGVVSVSWSPSPQNPLS